MSVEPEVGVGYGNGKGPLSKKREEDMERVQRLKT